MPVDRIATGRAWRKRRRDGYLTLNRWVGTAGRWDSPAVVLAVMPIVLFSATVFVCGEETDRQYAFEGIVVPAASSEEPRLAELSVAKASRYLEKGALAWSKARRCVSCHTNGSYLLIRPALSPTLGPPSGDIRDFFVEEVGRLEKTAMKRLLSGVYPTRAAYVAAGLAQWDRHVGGKLSPATSRALSLMFKVQSDDGAWGNADCWPPLESSRYHGATVAAMAVAAAPGWLQNQATESQRARFERLKKFLRSTPPAHDYERTLLLWSATMLPDLIDDARRQEIVQRLLKHQRPDGGWSIRTFSHPRKWGRGNRAEKLLGEPDFKTPASDGHQTGLVILVLRRAGLPADHPQLRAGVRWLLANQRRSGRWWTRSLNTDRFHFITYSGTIYPLLALQECGHLPPLKETAK